MGQQKSGKGSKRKAKQSGASSRNPASPSGRGAGSRGSGKRGGDDDVSPQARRKQMIVALVIGGVMGVVISFFTEFWLWLPAGLAMGLATGAIMKPPSDAS